MKIRPLFLILVLSLFMIAADGSCSGPTATPAPIEVPASAPVEAPAAAPVEAPVEVPAESGIESPAGVTASPRSDQSGVAPSTDPRACDLLVNACLVVAEDAHRDDIAAAEADAVDCIAEIFSAAPSCREVFCGRTANEDFCNRHGL